MPTIKQVLERTKLPDTIPDSFKYRWLGELERKTYKYPEDADTELKYDNEEVYEKYLIAMNDFFSGDLAKYNESAMEFYRAYGKIGVII